MLGSVMISISVSVSCFQLQLQLLEGSRHGTGENCAVLANSRTACWKRDELGGC